MRLDDVAMHIPSFIQDCEFVQGSWDDDRRKAVMMLAESLATFGLLDDGSEAEEDDGQSEVSDAAGVNIQLPEHNPFPSVSINDCPPEILSNIFQELVDFYYAGWDAPSSSISYGWMTVLWVCRFWRAVAFRSPRLFRYIDFTRIHPSALDTWLRHCGDVDLVVWLPHSHIPALQAALTVNPSLLSKVARLSLQVPFPDSEWTNYSNFPNVTDLCLCNDNDTSAPILYSPPTPMHNLRRLFISGHMPATLWHAGMFPKSLQEVKIKLDPMLRPETLDEDVLTSLHLLAAFDHLTELEQLYFSSDWVQPTGAERPLVLPRLKVMVLELLERDFPIVLALAPKPQGRPYEVDLSPYPHQDVEDRGTKEMVESALAFIKHRRGTFTCVGLDLIQDETEMALIDGDGAGVFIRIQEDIGEHFCALAEGIEAGSSVTMAMVGEHLERQWGFEDDERCTGILDVLRMLVNVTDVTVGGRLGVATRDLFVALAGVVGRILFGESRHEFVVWPRLQLVRLDSVWTDNMDGVSGTVVGFLGLAFLAINTPRSRIRTVKVQRSWFSEYDIVPWTHCVKTVIIQGMC